ncbi:hypothetical protein Hanom_Chr03g00196091 [Helianthus anomalus]
MVAHTLSEAEFYQWMNESLATLESQLKTVFNEFRSFRTTWDAQYPTLPPPVSATAPPVPPTSTATAPKPAPSTPTPKPSPPPLVPKTNPVLCRLSSNVSHSYSVVVSADSCNTRRFKKIKQLPHHNCLLLWSNRQNVSSILGQNILLPN